MSDTKPDVRALLDALDARINAIEVARKALGDERLLLLRTRAHYEAQSTGQPVNSVGPKQAAAPAAPAIISQMGLTNAVRYYIREFPGYTATQVINVLDGIVRTTSKEPRKIISWTIGELVRRKEVERRADSTLRPTPEGMTIELL
jgi:hypothetical protein